MKGSRIRRLLCWACVLALALGCVSAAQGETEKKKVTVMVYMCGSNLESDAMMATQSLGQMIRSRFNTDEVNVVVLGGGSKAWCNGFETKTLTLGEVGNTREIKTEQLPLAGMGDPETFSAFLAICAERYPAEENILVIWDHGGGPAHGVCQDELFPGDYLTLQEMGSVLKESPFADRGLDLVVFNACLMGSAELSVVLAPYAKYLVATEDSMYGLTYDWLSGVEKRTPLETAKRIADDSFAFNSEVIERQHATEINSFCVVDLERVPALNDAVDTFFAKVTPDLDNTSFTRMSQMRRNSVTFGSGASGTESGFDLVDLGDLVRHHRASAPQEADAVLAALNDAVVYHLTAVPECTGLTVYHPFANKEPQLMAIRVAVYNDLGFAPSYTAYVQQFSALLTGTRMADWSELHLSASAKKDQRTLFTMPLTEEQAEHFGSARMTALMKDPGGNYTFTWVGDGFEPVDGVLTAEYVHTSLCITDTEGNPSVWPLYYVRDARGNYLIPAELRRAEKETEDGVLPACTQEVLIACAYDTESRRLLPGSVLVRDGEMGGYTPAFNASFEDYDEIGLPLSAREESRDADGNLLPFEQWKVFSEDLYRREIDGSWEFRLLPDLIPNSDLYVAIEVEDSQNNRYLSDLAPVSAVPSAAAVTANYDDANLVKIETVSLTAANGYVNLSLSVTNLTDTEAIVGLENLTLGGRPVNIKAEAYGNGENWGLLPGESSILPVSVPLETLDGIDTLAEGGLTLTLKDAATDELLGSVPVELATSVSLTEAR